MTSVPLQDSAAIEKIVVQLVESRPAYASLLGFYGPVFTAQARAMEDAFSTPINVEEESLRMRQQEGFALIEPASFPIDFRAAEKLLVTICHLAIGVGEKLGKAGNALSLAVAEGIDVEDMFRDVLEKNGCIQIFAQDKDVPLDMLSLLLYLAIRPSIEAGARQLATRLREDGGSRSNCPVCGSAPILGELDADGNQWIHCSLCWHRWPAARMTCLSCGNRSRDSLEYFYSETEPEYRVYLCKDCGHYLKVVDTRQLTRGFLAPLEQVVSLHLDIKAAENGYSHAMGRTAGA